MGTRNFLAGFRRNKKKIQPLLERLRVSGKSVTIEYSNILPNWQLSSYFFFTTSFYSKKYPQISPDCFRKRNELNYSTINYFNKVWLKNFLSNLITIDKKKKIHILNEATLDWKNTSILFVGASPVLETEIEEIYQKRENIFLFSSDTSSYFLLKNGIVPDAILSVDPGRGTSYHFRQDLPEFIPIITWLGGNTELFRKPNPIFLIFTSYPLDQLLSSHLKNGRFVQNPGLNISTLALSLAEIFMAADFALSGVSFHSSGGKTHCRGTGYELFRISQINRFNTMENYSPGYYKNGISKKNLNSLRVIQNSKFGFKNISGLRESRVPTTKIQIAELEEIKLPLNEFIKSLQNLQIQNQILKLLEISPSLWNRYNRLLGTIIDK